MKHSIKTFLKLKEYAQIVVLWILAFFFFVFMTYSMVSDFYFHEFQTSAADFLLSQLLGALLVGMVMGTNFFLLQEYVYPRFFKNHGILLTTLLRTFLFLITCFIGLFIIMLLNRAHYINTDNLFSLHLDNLWMVSFTFYCLIVHVFITILQAFRRRVGKNYFESLLKGNYMIPVVEYRIFMFLDMYSSTAAAEEAGHYNYSLLLQECFADLSELLLLYDAEVYQYVGDEAVLTWKASDKFDRSLCVKLYQSYSSRLEDKEQMYQRKFGITPKFKASLNEGLVTVAEIGRIKTEIAYHGDVLSTAARVRDLCNGYKADLLVTQSFFDQLPFSFQKNFTAVGATILRGKKKAVAIYKPSSKMD